jgi:hypothetical protein
MGYWLATVARTLLARRPELICDRRTWLSGVQELQRRTLGGRRESGAFLLGKRGATATIQRFVFYDDIDPNALDSGIVIIDGRKLGDLWKLCRESQMAVVADVHVHPEGYGQSPSDKDNPIIAEVGHIALILPHFAEGSNMPGEIGVHRYLGNRCWSDESRHVFPPFHVGWYGWPT